MILTFRSKALALFWNDDDASKLAVPNKAGVRRVLDLLDAARVGKDMNLPGLRFHALGGRMTGRYAATISGDWRITFARRGEDVMDVDLEDYH